METVTINVIDLFADNLPSIEQIKQLSNFVNSSEANKNDFAKKVEENINRTSQDAVLATGIGLYILGQSQQALQKLQKAKDCKEKFLFSAFALRRLKQFDEAIENLQKSLDHQADELSINLEIAGTYRSASDLDAAEKQLKKSANFKDISAEYHYQSGRLQEAQGLYEQAISNYQKAIEISPDHQEALFHLAYRCDLSGDEQAAIDYYKQIVSTHPVYVNALLNLTVLYEDQENYEKAFNCITNVTQSHPNHQRAILFKKDINSSMTMYYDEEKEERKTRKYQILETPISDFELSVRSRNCLKKMNIHTLGDLLNISETELLSYKNFGETSLREIKAILDGKSLQLGMSLEEEHGNPEDTVNTDIEEESILSKPVDDLQLSVRSKRCLSRLNLRTFGELTRKTEAELLGCKNFGVTSLNEIKKALENFGLSFRRLE